MTEIGLVDACHIDLGLVIRSRKRLSWYWVPRKKKKKSCVVSVDKSLRGVSCVECRFCFFDESLESSFSDSEVGIFFFQLFGKSNQVVFRSGGKSTRVV